MRSFLVVVSALSCLWLMPWSCSIRKSIEANVNEPIHIDSVQCIEHYKATAGGNISRTYRFFITHPTKERIWITSMAYGEDIFKGHLEDNLIRTKGTHELDQPGQFIYRCSVIWSSAEKFTPPEILYLTVSTKETEKKIPVKHPIRCFNPDID